MVPRRHHHHHLLCRQHPPLFRPTARPAHSTPPQTARTLRPPPLPGARLRNNNTPILQPPRTVHLPRSRLPALSADPTLLPFHRGSDIGVVPARQPDDGSLDMPALAPRPPSRRQHLLRRERELRQRVRSQQRRGRTHDEDAHDAEPAGRESGGPRTRHEGDSVRAGHELRGDVGRGDVFAVGGAIRWVRTGRGRGRLPRWCRRRG